MDKTKITPESAAEATNVNLQAMVARSMQLTHRIELLESSLGDHLVIPCQSSQDTKDSLLTQLIEALNQLDTLLRSMLETWSKLDHTRACEIIEKRLQDNSQKLQMYETTQTRGNVSFEGILGAFYTQVFAQIPESGADETIKRS